MISQHRIIAALSYVPLLFLIPLLTYTDDEFVQFHGKQGLVLFVVWFAVWLMDFVPLIGIIVPYVGYLALIVVSIIAFVRTLMGGRWEIPFVARYAKRIKL